MVNTSREEKLARFERLSKRERIMTGTEFALEYCGEHGSKPAQEPGPVRVNLLVELLKDPRYFPPPIRTATRYWASCVSTAVTSAGMAFIGASWSDFIGEGMRLHHG
jgi:hypothetical protein